MNDEYDKTEKPPVEDWAMSEPDIQPEQPVGADNFDITLVGVKSPSAAAVTEDWAMNVPDVQPEQPVVSDNFDITMVGANAPSTAATTEDWAVNVPNTNPSAEKIADVWEMPPPVFRISSGRKLDKDNRKTPPMPPPDSPPVEAQTSEIVEPVAPPNLDIQLQPYISEEFSTNQVAAKTFVKPKSSSSLKLILLIVGLVVLGVLAAAFAAGVYYWFFYTPE